MLTQWLVTAILLEIVYQTWCLVINKIYICMHYMA